MNPFFREKSVYIYKKIIIYYLKWEIANTVEKERVYERILACEVTCSQEK